MENVADAIMWTIIFLVIYSNLCELHEIAVILMKKDK